MKYRNAQDIFPDNLLKQIQRYVAGETIYIPAGDEKKAWGETSGYRRYIQERNKEIKSDFADGSSIDALADKYSLSFDTIKRIVYSKKEVAMLEYFATLSSARAYAHAGKLDAWIHLYLNSNGRNIPFSDGLKLFERSYIGPMEMPIDLFDRCTGPEDNMKFRIDAKWFALHVKELEKAIQENPDMPPLISHYVEHGFEMNDGNHRLQAYKNLGFESINVIIWITEIEEYDEFIERFGEYAKDAPVIRK